jgi:hypothetical protein
MMAEIQPIIDRHLSEMSHAELNFLLTKYKKYLKIDIQRDLEKARANIPLDSTFDDILGDLP